MRTSLLNTLLLTLSLGIVETLRADGPAWKRDFNQAAQEAKDRNKDLFVLFTGHGWCASCEVLDREVFRQQKFVTPTASDFVFVELDINFGDSAEEEQRKTTLMKLQSQYLAPAVPTVVLSDNQGVPYGYITGYEAGDGPDALVARIASARKAKEDRDRLKLQAAAQSGILKAKLLSNALDSIAPHLGEMKDRGDDPLLRFYGDTINEIIKLDTDKGGVADKFIKLREQRNAWLVSGKVFERLEEFDASKDYTGAIHFIDTVLLDQESPELRWRLEYARQVYLEWNGQFERALENCRRLLTLNAINDKDRDALLDREFYNLFQLGRIDEGLSHFDKRIEEAEGDLKKRMRLLHWKTQMVHGRAPVEQSIAVMRAYRKATELGTEDWFNATSLLASELRRAERHAEAIQLVDELLEKRRDTWLLLDAVESYIALGKTTESMQFVSEAETQANALKDSPRKGDRDLYTHLSARIAGLKDALAAMSGKNDRTKR